MAARTSSMPTSTEPHVWPVVALTAHRETESYGGEANREWAMRQISQVASELYEHCASRVAISGMTRGGDLWWAHAALRRGFELWAYVPFPQQTKLWNMRDQRDWHGLVRVASKVKYFGDLDDQPEGRRTGLSTRLLHARNAGMVADANVIIAAWNPYALRGGTRTTVDKALIAEKPLIHIDPVNRRVTWRT